LTDVCRVAVVTDTPAFGGAEVYLTTLVRRLADRYRFTALIGDQAPEELSRRLSCPVDVIPGLRRRPHPLPWTRLFGALRRMGPDLVHLNLTDQGDGLTLITAAGLVRRPVVATLHDVIPGRHQAKERVSGWALRRCACVIAPSRAVAASVTAAGAVATVVGHGLDFPTPDRDAARAALGLPPDALVVGGVGRLHRQKGWDILGRAAEVVATRVPAARFVLVGDGPLREHLETSFPAMRLAGYHEEAARLAAGFDVIAAPSRYDAFGLAPVEAMAAGVPVVAAAVDALPEVVGPGAVLVPPDDVEAFAGALTGLLQDPRRRRELGRAGRAWASNRFSAARMAEETAAVFDASIATAGR
jgi:glycosyltransferase involved in cell wall biosynthesis